jgi:hypothetical protein
MSQNGKGDKTRPKSVDYTTWSKNFDRIFKNEKKQKKTTKTR